MLEGGAGEGRDACSSSNSTSPACSGSEFPAEQVQPIVMIEGPRILFPFARQIVAEAVRNGGYPPLYVDPIDFQGLYLQRRAATGPSVTAAGGRAALGRAGA